MKKIIKYIIENQAIILFCINWFLIMFFVANTYFKLNNHLKNDEKFNCTLLKNIGEIESYNKICK